MGIFLDHTNTVLSKLRETPVTALSTDATTEAYKAQEAVNRAIARIWNAKQWSFKIRSYTLSLTASTTAYALPPFVGEIFSAKSSASPYLIPLVSENQLDKYDPQRVDVGAPQALRVFDLAGVRAQPPSASVVTVSSSSASDTAGVVTVRGIVGGGMAVEAIALSGPAPSTR